ncbi:MAG: UbiA family prenyltransferase [Fimbriimonadia bacterium]|jgi:4-hydroxybenzoate polyprenyltransferase
MSSSIGFEPLRPLGATREFLELVKFEHSVFALPFALIGMLLAAEGFPAPSVLMWLLVAMVSARSVAMAFNRIVDAKLDALNPRTANRALPAGRLTLAHAWMFLAVMLGLFVLSTWFLNPLALRLGPVALALVMTYSYSKRFTWLSHLWLGAAIGVAPTAAWIAVTGSLAPGPAWFSAAVMCWIAGFDILYSLADEEFDRVHRLHSAPARFGATRAIAISRLLHVLTVAMLVGGGLALGLGVVYYVGVAVVAVALAYEQWLVRPNDLTRLNTAFFTANGFVSIALFVFVLADWMVRR